MIILETPLSGAYVIELEPISDDRGHFSRTYCQQEFERAGLQVPFVQCNTSFNHKSGTVRGMHYQDSPHEETKLIRCTRGAIYDVIVDIRSGSETYMQWFGVELTEQNDRMLYVPEGFAHGFQTLKDNTEVFYQMGEFFYPEASRGMRWDDASLSIKWPLPCEVISDKDKSYPVITI